jgi:hypothetical protein
MHDQALSWNALGFKTAVVSTEGEMDTAVLDGKKGKNVVYYCT